MTTEYLISCQTTSPRHFGSLFRVATIQNTRRERIFATAVWMCTGVLQNQNKLARVAQGYGKRRGVVNNFIVTLNNLYLLKNNVERQSIFIKKVLEY